jgi:L-fuculose-phosphate aldolase
MTMNVENPRQSLITAALDAEVQRLNIGTTGNISARLNGGMLITPSGIPPKKLKPELIVAMDLDGVWSGDINPSTEWALHAAIYKSRPQVSAVMHAHPDHCVALSCARENLPAFHYMVAGFGGDDVRCSKYASFGSPELAKFAVEALENRTACLLANHGMVAIGTSVAEAFSRTVKLETMVRQFLLCRSFAAPVLLTANEMTEVEQRYRGGYGRQAAPVV